MTKTIDDNAEWMFEDEDDEDADIQEPDRKEHDKDHDLETTQAMNVLDEKIRSKQEPVQFHEYIDAVIHGDCLKTLSSMPGACVDLCITDPPWGVDFWTFRDKFKDQPIKSDDLKGYNELMLEFPSCLYRVMKQNTSVYMFSGKTKPIIPQYREHDIQWPMWDMMVKMYKAGFTPRRVLVWDQGSPGRWFRYRSRLEFILYFTKGNSPKWSGESEIRDDLITEEVLRCPRVSVSNKHHAAEKPVQLYQAFMLDASEQGDLVMDPFAGSGTVVEAARNTARKFLAIDIDENNIEHIKSRSKQMSIYDLIENNGDQK